MHIAIVRGPKGVGVVISSTKAFIVPYKILDRAVTDDELIIDVSITDIQ